MPNCSASADCDRPADFRRAKTRCPKIIFSSMCITY
nr:MAG TPA: hypothetical protein [Caudoviricetes sp.]